MDQEFEAPSYDKWSQQFSYVVGSEFSGHEEKDETAILHGEPARNTEAAIGVHNTSIASANSIPQVRKEKAKKPLRVSEDLTASIALSSYDLYSSFMSGYFSEVESSSGDGELNKRLKSDQSKVVRSVPIRKQKGVTEKAR